MPASGRWERPDPLPQPQPRSSERAPKGQAKPTLRRLLPRTGSWKLSRQAPETGVPPGFVEGPAPRAGKALVFPLCIISLFEEKPQRNSALSSSGLLVSASLECLGDLSYFPGGNTSEALSEF